MYSSWRTSCCQLVVGKRQNAFTPTVSDSLQIIAARMFGFGQIIAASGLLGRKNFGECICCWNGRFEHIKFASNVRTRLRIEMGPVRPWDSYLNKNLFNEFIHFVNYESFLIDSSNKFILENPFQNSIIIIFHTEDPSLWKSGKFLFIFHVENYYGIFTFNFYGIFTLHGLIFRLWVTLHGL